MHFNWPPGKPECIWEIVWRESGDKGEPVVNFKVPNQDLWMSAVSASSTPVVPWPSGTLWNENPALLFGLFGTLHNCKIGSVQVNTQYGDGAHLRAIGPLRAPTLTSPLAPQNGVPISANGADGIHNGNRTWTLTYISGGSYTASGEHARV